MTDSNRPKTKFKCANTECAAHNRFVIGPVYLHKQKKYCLPCYKKLVASLPAMAGREMKPIYIA